MTIKPICNFCNQELNEFGAILLSPPDERSNVKKYHVCKRCYQRITEKLR